MIIKNKRELAITPLRRRVLEIADTGISSVLPSSIIKSAIHFDSLSHVLTVCHDKYDLSKGRIFIVGGGKASTLMAQAIEQVLTPDNIVAGIINCKHQDLSTTKITIVEAGHPIPDERGLEGVKQMLELKDRYSINQEDLVICLISGGGSALMPYPVEGVMLRDKQKITDLLLRCGATIHEINIVRKHLSKIKGGGLGRFFTPATIVALILSDVIGNDFDIIASGQTCADSSTFALAYGVLRKYKLLQKAPSAVIEHLIKGCRGEVPETPKNLANCRNYLIGDVSIALSAMEIKAKKLGFNPLIISSVLTGDTSNVAHFFASEIISGMYKDYDLLLLGGETTLKLPNNAGKGGRNQHYAATSILAMQPYNGEWVVASLGTDGSDFIPDIAGAIVGNESLNKLEPRAIDIRTYLTSYDSYHLLKKIGNSLIKTGSTGTNVGDIIIYGIDKQHLNIRRDN
jgi:glycerate 2-kinase